MGKIKEKKLNEYEEKNTLKKRSKKIERIWGKTYIKKEEQKNCTERTEKYFKTKIRNKLENNV